MCEREVVVLQCWYAGAQRWAVRVMEAKKKTEEEVVAQGSSWCVCVWV